jgi:hypothetical protein
VSGKEWLVTVFFAAGAIPAGGFVHREWKIPGYFAREEPLWWLWGDSLWRAWLRTTPMSIAACALLAVALPLLSYRSSASGVATTVLSIVGGLIVASLLTALFGFVSVALLNRPKVLVPPIRRKDAGLLLETRRLVARLVRK